jgi:hypothetical protein
VQVEIVGKAGDARRDIGHAIELGEDPKILAHRQAVRQGDIGALEIHAVEHAMAVDGHVVAEDAHASRRRQDEAEDHADGRGLAGAVAAEDPGDRPRFDLKADPVDGGDGLVALGQRFDLDRRMRCFIEHGRRSRARRMRGYLPFWSRPIHSAKRWGPVNPRKPSRTSRRLLQL